jgi:hypothetical protein
MAEYPIHNSKYFDVREFVHPATWKALGVKAAAQVDVRIVRICDLLREKTGVPGYVNNWHYSSHPTPYVASGHRSRTERTGGFYSQHRAGRAADYKATGFTPDMLLHIIAQNAVEFEAAGLTTIEDLRFTPTWLHLDCRPKIKGVNPETGFLIVIPK